MVTRYPAGLLGVVGREEEERAWEFTESQKIGVEVGLRRHLDQPPGETKAQKWRDLPEATQVRNRT